MLGSTDNGKTYKSYRVGQGLHDAGDAEPERQRLPAAVRQRASRAPAAPTRRRRRPSTALAGNYPAATFVDDEYDLSNLIGKPGAVVRFTYATDPGLARPGWFIDDVAIKADDKVIYSIGLRDAPNDPALYNGGCREGLATAQRCTTAGSTSPPTRTRRPSTPTCSSCATARASTPTARASPTAATSTFEPGVLLAYTDEDHGYGNVGTDDPPAQTPLDSRPEPGSDTPNLDDAAFKAGDAFSDAGAGHTDNYTDGRRQLDAQVRLPVVQGRPAGRQRRSGRRSRAPTTSTATSASPRRASCGRFDYGNGAISEGVADAAAADPADPGAAAGRTAAPGGAPAPAPAPATPRPRRRPRARPAA